MEQTSLLLSDQVDTAVHPVLNNRTSCPPWIGKKESWTKWLRDYHESLNQQYADQCSKEVDKAESAKTAI